MSGDHDHGPSPADISARRERRLLIALVLNCVIVAGEATAGILAKSVGLLADAGHNLTDVGGIALALFAVRWARRSPTAKRAPASTRRHRLRRPLHPRQAGAA